MDAFSLLAEACSESMSADSGAVHEVQEFPTTIEITNGLNENDDSKTDGDASFQFKTSSRGNWTAEEDDLLRNAVQQYGGRNWKKISDLIADRTDVQCLHRWQKVLRPGLIKGPWTPEVQFVPCFSSFVSYMSMLQEDNSVVELVARYGVKSWSFIARQLKGRLGKQCRERCLRAFLKKWSL